MVPQTTTPIDLLLGPNKDALRSKFVGKTLDGIRTPAFIVDQSLFAKNCASMHQKAEEWGATFRAHLKTHKTAEGARLQLVSEKGCSYAVVVSTLLEAWSVVSSGLVKEGIAKDILYGLPVGVDRIADLSRLWEEIEPHGGIVRILIDHEEQVRHLEDFEKLNNKHRRWSVFVKVHNGQNRAGVHPESSNFRNLVRRLLQSSAISIHGFYGHAGNSYGSTSMGEASSFLSGEVQTVNKAAEIALEEISKQNSVIVHRSDPFVLSVGSTPTAHAAGAEARQILSQTLRGKLELHAGNYPMLDLQQRHTTLISNAQIAQKVRVTVISHYPGRGAEGRDEALVDAGAIAFSKDSGPSGGFGEVIGRPWKLVRMSQEHGIIAEAEPSAGQTEKLEIGTVLDITGQHACLIAAAYPWYYIVDENIKNGEEIVDIWVPWKGW